MVQVYQAWTGNNEYWTGVHPVEEFIQGKRAEQTWLKANSEDLSRLL